MIDRKMFIEMCQKCAVLPKVAGVVSDVPKELTVLWKGTKYYPVGYEVFFGNDGRVVQSAIIHDMKANSVIRARFEDVELLDSLNLTKMI